MRTRSSAVTCLVLWVAVWLVLGCERSTQSVQPGPNQTQSTAVVDHKVTPPEAGQEVVCLVMKTRFKVTSDTLAAEYKGKVYYFCCPTCPGAFKADPEKYTSSR